MNEEEKKQLNELVAWKKAREAEQITLPLDPKSLDILSEYFVRFQDVVAFDFIGASSHVVPIYFGRQGDRVFEMSSSYIRVSVNIATDQVIVTDQNQFTKFVDGMRVSFYVDELTGGVFPGGITGGYGDFVVANASADGFMFTLEDFATLNPVDITSIGEGKLFIQIYF